MPLPRDDRDHPRAAAFRAFIRETGFPCVGAKAALSRGRMRVLVARSVTSAWDDMRIYPALLAFAARYRARPDTFQSLAVVFEDPCTLSEAAFERHLWERLQSLADKDAWLGHAWDERVAPDPDNPHFSLSFGGEAFFVVGLHPGASRPARRFSSPALVFNPHRQFESLREAGRYERLRASIVQRDVALSGSANPMLARHGEVSEARQYSGRAVDEGWRCPFRPRTDQQAAGTRTAGGTDGR
ncbi:guanitoxin biosynthesis heme-dependent pre-guanitoxin N-hydroxylase GntA [Methylobacterium frigidaeris]|nr:guanitoxin biosynthesis heme-dependent pre-guanitoxin N-hydroxylase GntA [Methylobacterium frigidaeris]